MSSIITRRQMIAGALGVGASLPFLPLLLKKKRPRPVPQRFPPRGGFRQNYFTDVPLLTHENKKVRFYTDLLKDKIAVINFMYTHCEGLCPRQTANLVEVQKELGNILERNIHFYSLSL